MQELALFILYPDMKKFSIVPYSSQWSALFEFYKQKLSVIFGENLTALYHIGSTSVTGLSAKPVIDLMPTVFSMDAVDDLQSEFEKEGFQWRGEFGIFGRRYLTLDDGNGNRICHVHIFETSSLEVEKHLSFRDLLRRDSKKAQEYERLKLKLFAEFPEGNDHYQNGMEDFIQKTTAAALADQNDFRIPTQVCVWIVCLKQNEPKYLMFKRSEKAGGFWQGITGAPFANEEIEAGAMRELFEETGIGPNQKVSSLDFGYCFPVLGAWKIAYRSEVEKIVEKVFVTFVDDFVEPKLSDEHTEFRWCSYQEGLELLKWPNNKASLQVLHKKLVSSEASFNRTVSV